VVLAVCEATRAQLLELEPSLAGRTHVTYTGIPDEMFEIRGHPVEGPLRVVFIGSLTEEKDPLLALRAVAGVPEAVLRFVGGGGLADAVAAEAAELGVADRVERVGPVEDVRPHLAWANVLLLTSRTEGLPGPVLEAGAASRPAVALGVGGVAEAIRDGITGVVVDPADPEGLTTALATLAADRGLLRKLGGAARLHMKQSFALDHIVAGYATRLGEVVE
jgi:glycosyltransferase involved in cell wall biosynthesis